MPIRNDKVYVYEDKKLLRWLVPFDLRKGVMMPWLIALVAPLQFVYRKFTRYRIAVNYRLMITGQVVYLEVLLNDRYDRIQRRIFITDGEGVEPIWLYTDDELQPKDLYTAGEGVSIDLYTEGEVDGDQANDFIIHIPAVVRFVPEELVSLVKTKRLPGMNFGIQIF